MNIEQFRHMAGLPILDSKEALILEKKLSAIAPKVEIPEGTFTKSARSIVNTLIDVHGGDLKKAQEALTFYINRVGVEVSNSGELEKAKEILSKKMMNESLASVLRAAGLPVFLREADKEESEESESTGEEKDEDADESKDEDESKESEEEKDEENLPSIVKKIAKKAVDKDEDELEKLLMSIYQAGFKDGQIELTKDEGKNTESESNAEEGERAESEEVKKDEVKESLLAAFSQKR